MFRLVSGLGSYFVQVGCRFGSCVSGMVQVGFKLCFSFVFLGFTLDVGCVLLLVLVLIFALVLALVVALVPVELLLVLIVVLVVIVLVKVVLMVAVILPISILVFLQQ